MTKVLHSFDNDPCCPETRANIRASVGTSNLHPDNILYPAEECYTTLLDAQLQISNIYTCTEALYGNYVLLNIVGPNIGSSNAYLWSIAEISIHHVPET